VQCKLDSGAWGACTSYSGTAGTYATGVLADGAHTFSVKHTDSAGNTSTVGSTLATGYMTWTIDTTAPTAPSSLTRTSPSSSPSTSTTASFTFTIGESGGTTECRLDSGSWAACTSVTGTSGAYSLSGLTSGDHTVSVRQTDSVGNVSSTTTSAIWTVGTPTASISDGPGTACASGATCTLPYNDSSLSAAQWSYTLSPTTINGLTGQTCALTNQTTSSTVAGAGLCDTGLSPTYTLVPANTYQFSIKGLSTAAPSGGTAATQTVTVNPSPPSLSWSNSGWTNGGTSNAAQRSSTDTYCSDTSSCTTANTWPYASSSTGSKLNPTWSNSGGTATSYTCDYSDDGTTWTGSTTCSSTTSHTWALNTSGSCTSSSSWNRTVRVTATNVTASSSITQKIHVACKNAVLYSKAPTDSYRSTTSNPTISIGFSVVGGTVNSCYWDAGWFTGQNQISSGSGCSGSGQGSTTTPADSLDSAPYNCTANAAGCVSLSSYTPGWPNDVYTKGAHYLTFYLNNSDGLLAMGTSGTSFQVFTSSTYTRQTNGYTTNAYTSCPANYGSNGTTLTSMTLWTKRICQDGSYASYGGLGGDQSVASGYLYVGNSTCFTKTHFGNSYSNGSSLGFYNWGDDWQFTGKLSSATAQQRAGIDGAPAVDGAPSYNVTSVSTLTATTDKTCTVYQNSTALGTTWWWHMYARGNAGSGTTTGGAYYKNFTSTGTSRTNSSGGACV